LESEALEWSWDFLRCPLDAAARDWARARILHWKMAATGEDPQDLQPGT